MHLLQAGIFLAFLAVPVSIAFAILRYGLYDIDRLISRTVGYVLVTLVLVGVYALLVLAPTSFVSSGRAAPPWLVALGTLAVAVLFNPLRRRLQSSVDHRFNRRRYDAARVIEEFGTRLRQEVDLGELLPAIEDVIHQTMQPATVRLTLLP
jgi:uncharacterized membrane protein YbhN (UPF0104 family)